jgi:hypothetical protein
MNFVFPEKFGKKNAALGYEGKPSGFPCFIRESEFSG